MTMTIEILEKMLSVACIIVTCVLLFFAFFSRRYRFVLGIVFIILVFFTIGDLAINYFGISELWRILTRVIVLIISIYFIQEERLIEEKAATNIFIEAFVEVLEEQTGNKYSYYEELIGKKIESKNISSILKSRAVKEVK